MLLLLPYAAAAETIQSDWNPQMSLTADVHAGTQGVVVPLDVDRAAVSVGLHRELQ